MKKYIAVALLFIVSVSSSAQKIGEWKNYKSYHNATKCVAGGNRIYTLCDGSIFSYNTSDTEVITYDKANYLTDNDIQDIAYCSSQKVLIIAYTDANIDLLYDNDDVYNVSDYKLNEATDKTINSINIVDNIAYLSTNNGLLLFDVAKREFINNYKLNKAVKCSNILDNTIYAVTADGIYTGETTKNLLDINNWSKISSISPKQIIKYKDNMLYLFADAVYSSDFTKQFIKDSTSGLSAAYECNDELWILGTNNQYTLSASTTVSTDKIEYNNLYWQPNQILFPSNCVTYCNSLYWSAEGEKGLVGYNYANGGLDIKVNSVIPDSPITNTMDKMCITSSGLTIVSGKHQFAGQDYDTPGNVMKLLPNGSWLNFENGTTVTDKTGERYVNPVNVAEDPRDPNHCFVTATGYGVYEFYNGKFVKMYSASDTSNTLHTLYNNSYYTWTSGLCYDKSNNLYILNFITDTSNNKFSNAIKIIKADGTWTEIAGPSVLTEDYPNNIMVSSTGLIWSTIYWNHPGIWCMDNNGTVDDTSDDNIRFISSIYNQDGTVFDYWYTSCITEDKDGYIWLGTSGGPIVIKSPSTFLTNTSTTPFTQVKIPRNDGTNYADYLLSEVATSAIAIDGANRKWFGTNSGVYLYSEDCTELIEHFTTDNSSLIDNTIADIKISSDGEVFIATSKGLCSYRGDASEAAESLVKNDIYAYPNPVKSDYDGVITIKGLTYNSKVKIVNTVGRLMAEGTSNGGEFCWDGKDYSGNRVASGVYFVLIGDSDLKNGASTKILMLK